MIYLTYLAHSMILAGKAVARSISVGSGSISSLPRLEVGRTWLSVTQ